MKKIFIISLVVLSFFFSGCSQSPQTQTSENTSTFSLLDNLTTKYPYIRKMEKPLTSEMSNRDAIQNGFHEEWKTNYHIPDIDLSDPTYTTYCRLSGFSLVNVDNGKTLKTVPFTSVKKNATFEVQDRYNGLGLGLEFSHEQKNFFDAHGRMVFKTNSGFLEEMKGLTQYDGDGGNPDVGGDERVDSYEKIVGSTVAYQRYPYNTLLVTSDLLLHIYHRVFDNSLKYYEETIARPMLTELSQSLFKKFINLAKNTSSPELKKNYEFLSAYWSVPYILLIPNNELIDKIATNTNENPEIGDLSDEQMQTLIKKRQKQIVAQLSSPYQTAVKTTVQEILSAESSDGKNTLLETLSPELLTNFQEFDSLKFDYTQFKPRAHYTTDSLLKTYFMGMKWLMREKLFFADKNATNASLIMINNIKDNDLEQFTEFYSFIQKLIGEDDDVNISDIQKFIADQQWSSDTAIIQGTDATIQKKLITLRPQRIMSVSYTTPEIGQVTEQEAKDDTAGFIFFGEKFTIDSWFFDQSTAGSAEKEGAYKPRVQSALMVADTLLNIPVTQKFAQLWLEKNSTIFEISPAQIAGYNNVKGDISKNEILTKFDFGSTVYHTWIKMLASLFIDTGINAPYFLQDSLYQNKLLTTFLGSYTELKHDTLLYVKQAYAEMGGGGNGPCDLAVEPPELPVPKGYIEANPDLIDQIISLTKSTTSFFSGEQYTQFLNYLQLVKKIAVAQTQNKKTVDSDFESLRTATRTLTNITTPQKLFGQPLQKEKRGSIIADIFTSGKYGPLYEAVGRPYMMALMINDINGKRIALGPIFSHYEFYPSQAPMDSNGRFTDENRQNNYDKLKGDKEINILSLPFAELIQNTK